MPSTARRASAIAAETDRDQPLIDALQDADLFAGEPLAILETAPPKSGLHPLAEPWMQWARARTLIADMCQVDRLLAEGALIVPN